MPGEILTEFAVDSSDKFVDNGAKVLIFLNILSRRDSNLHQDDFANPFGMLCQEDFKGMELLRDTLDVVETVDTDNQLYTLELALQRCNALHDLWFFKTFVKLFWINTDRKRSYGHNFALELDRIGCSG